MMTLLLSRYEIAVYQWIFFIAGFSISAYAISVQGILLEITNNDNRAIYAGISGTLSLTTAINVFKYHAYEKQNRFNRESRSGNRW